MAEPGEVEYELGVPIRGRFFPRDRWVRTAIKRLPAEGPLDWQTIFGRSSPVVLDLGCGNGRFCAGQRVGPARDRPLGLDILPVVIRYATRRANQRGLGNVRFAVCGGLEFLEKYVAAGTIAEIHLYHPQPYGDAQKIGRRLITPAFLALVHRSLAREGLLVLQTDNPAYWRYLATLHLASSIFTSTRAHGPTLRRVAPVVKSWLAPWACRYSAVGAAHGPTWTPPLLLLGRRSPSPRFRRPRRQISPSTAEEATEKRITRKARGSGNRRGLPATGHLNETTGTVGSILKKGD